MFLEYEDVLNRDVQKAVSGLTTNDIPEVLAALAAVLAPGKVHYGWRPQLPDPGDELVLDAAVNGRTHAIVTHNKRHFAAAALLFDVQVWSSARLLRRLVP